MAVYNGAKTWEMSVGQHVEQNSKGLKLSSVRRAIGFAEVWGRRYKDKIMLGLGYREMRHD